VRQAYGASSPSDTPFAVSGAVDEVEGIAALATPLSSAEGVTRIRGLVGI
jgi:hypothetical protein